MAGNCSLLFIIIRPNFTAQVSQLVAGFLAPKFSTIILSMISERSQYCNLQLKHTFDMGVPLYSCIFTDEFYSELSV